MPVTPKSIGDKIKARITYLRMKQADLAKDFGCAEGTMSSYISGKRELSSTDMERLAEILGVRVGYFYGQDEFSEADPLGKRPTLIAFYDGLADYPEIQDDLVALAKTMWERKQKAEHVHGRKADEGDEERPAA